MQPAADRTVRICSRIWVGGFAPDQPGKGLKGQQGQKGRARCQASRLGGCYASLRLFTLIYGYVVVAEAFRIMSVRPWIAELSGRKKRTVRVCPHLSAFVRIPPRLRQFMVPSFTLKVGKSPTKGRTLPCAVPEAGAPGNWEKMRRSAEPPLQKLFLGVGQAMSYPLRQTVRMNEIKKLGCSGKLRLPKTVCVGPFRHSPCGGNAAPAAGVPAAPAFALEIEWNGQLTKNSGSLMMAGPTH
jgi:hypothetical protein